MNICDILASPIPEEELLSRIIKRVEHRNKIRGYSMQEKAAYINAHHPEEANRILAQAEQIMQGMMILPGTDNKHVFVGNPPAWLNNPTKDDEYLWCLNRMYYWSTLLKAYSMTGDGRYAIKVIDELENWISCCPRPSINTNKDAAYQSYFSPTPWRTLEAGIRMYDSWPLVFEFLAGTEFLTPAIVSRMAVSMHEHAEVLHDICPIFWPKADHNHYLMECLGLLSIAVLFPELAGSKQWLDHAIRELERCADAQLTIEGGQIEGCPSYHNGCICWFCIAVGLATETDRNFSPAFMSRLEKGLEYTVQASRPTGGCVPWGDSDALDWGTSAAIWWREKSADTLPLRMLNRFVPAPITKRIVFENAWAVRDLDKLLADIDKTEATPADMPRLFWNKELKQASFRTSWKTDALHVFFACRTPVNNGHAHIDPMGFDFSALGKSLLVDPGRYTYRECEERKSIKSAAWHNTLTINNRDPFEYKSSWLFGEQREGKIVNTWEKQRLLAAAAVQENYAPAIHRRLIAIVDDAILVVIDDLTKLPSKASVQIYYHFDSTNVRWNNNQQQAFAQYQGVKLTLAVKAQSGKLAGALLPGKVSDIIDVWRDSLRLRLEDTGDKPDRRIYSTIIVPSLENQKMTSISTPEISSNNGEIQCWFEISGMKRMLTWSEKDVTVK